MLLEQCLPFTVLKPTNTLTNSFAQLQLEQCLPFTVLKLNKFLYFDVVLELEQCLPFTVLKQMELTTKVPVEHGWNSAYRLRY